MMSGTSNRVRIPPPRLCNAAKRWHFGGSVGVFACLVSLLSPTGCAPDAAPEPDLVGDARFTAEEREAVQAGATWLYEQVGEPSPVIAWRDGPDLDIVRERRGATGLCSGGVVYLDPIGEPGEGMRIEHLPGLAAHELAHCVLGFVDAYHAGETQSDGIMRVLTPMCWTDAERAQCAASPRCPVAGR